MAVEIFDYTSGYGDDTYTCEGPAVDVRSIARGASLPKTR
jgi:hypothetical protein